jgi:hypothetical protein
VKILTRMCTSLDGRVMTPAGLPVQLALPGWDAGVLGSTSSKGNVMPCSWAARYSSRLFPLRSGHGETWRFTCSVHSSQ